MYDVLHDGDYRRCWDENMVECYEICQLDRYNDIGYYSSKLIFILEMWKKAGFWLEIKIKLVYLKVYKSSQRMQRIHILTVIPVNFSMQFYLDDVNVTEQSFINTSCYTCGKILTVL